MRVTAQMEAEQEPIEAAPLEAEDAEPDQAPAAEEAEQAQEAEAAEAEATDLSVMLRGRVAIFPDQPLPQYSSKHAVAFHAQIRNDPARPLLALLCDPDVPSRVDYMESMRSY